MSTDALTLRSSKVKQRRDEGRLKKGLGVE
jgi:hypothetical protein